MMDVLCEKDDVNRGRCWQIAEEWKNEGQSRPGQQDMYGRNVVCLQKNAMSGLDQPMNQVSRK